MTKPNNTVLDEEVQGPEGGGEQYLTFGLGNEVYGISVEHVKEVNEYRKLLKVPRVPDYIRGIVNLRGEVVPVIRLSYRLYGTPAEISKSSCIVILELHGGDDRIPVGIVIDAVKEVVEIRSDSIEATPSFSLNIREDFVDGVGKVRDAFIIMLNAGKVLDLDELSQFSGSEVERVQIAV